MIRKLLVAQLLVVAVIATIHLLGLEFYLYWRFLWLDTLTHALGGVWAGLFTYTALVLLRFRPHIILCILGTLTIGIAWELFELYAGIPREANFAFDTSLDILMDTLGGIIGFLVGKSLAKREISS